MIVYKVFRPEEWAILLERGETFGAEIDIADGFIHFSTAAQLPETLQKHFTNEAPLHLLGADGERLGEALKWEPSRGGALFPHLYRPLSLREISTLGQISWDGTRHLLPDGWRDV